MQAPLPFSHTLPLDHIVLGCALLLILGGLWLILLRRQVRRRTAELTRSEQRALQAQRRLSILIDHAPIGLWSMDRDLRFTSAEGHVLSEMGLSEETLVGTTLPELIGSADTEDSLMTQYQQAFAGTPVRYDVEWQGRTWDVRLRPIEDEGVVASVLGAAVDVTHNRETERRLEEQSAHFRTLFESAPEAIVLVDEEDRILQVNPEFQRLFGYDPAEATGRPINDLIIVPGREAEATEVTHRVARGERIEMETVRRHRDGSPIEVSILATPVDIGGHRRVYGIYRDITVQKELEAQLMHSQRLEAVGRLAGGVAHDFNNMLTAILGYARVLIEDQSDDTQIRRDLKQIEAAGERAAQLTRQLLTFSRRQQVAYRLVDLNEVILEMRDFLDRLIEEHIQVSLELAPDLPAVEADPGQLQQIVMNLVINARDAMPQGGAVTIATSVAGRGGCIEGHGVERNAPRAEHVVLAVRDEGCGMRPEEEARMFEPFFTTKGPGEGTGLGLSTVYGIVQQAGGFIEVETAPDRGTTMRVCLPAQAGTAAATDEAQPEPATCAAGDETILLVDDDRAVREVTQRILERAGYRVLAASSGRAALELCERQAAAPAMVLSDMVMPGMNGIQLVAQLRERYPAIGALLMTGYSEVRPTVDDEPEQMIRKPFDSMTLLHRMREQLSAT